jgi:hypothetical protein
MANSISPQFRGYSAWSVRFWRIYLLNLQNLSQRLLGFAIALEYCGAALLQQRPNPRNVPHMQNGRDHTTPGRMVLIEKAPPLNREMQTATRGWLF